VTSLLVDREASVSGDGQTATSTSPARPSSKKFKKGIVTPTRSRPTANPPADQKNSVSSWMMSAAQYGSMTQSLQKFLESRQRDTLSQTSPSGSTSVLHEDQSSDSLAPPSLYFQHISPQSQGNMGNSNNCYNSSLVLASSYMQLWFTLLETQWTDPHPLVSKAAKYILGYVKIEVYSPNPSLHLIEIFVSWLAQIQKRKLEEKLKVHGIDRIPENLNLLAVLNLRTSFALTQPPLRPIPKMLILQESRRRSS
jgi:hypothetical protein